MVAESVAGQKGADTATRTHNGRGHGRKTHRNPEGGWSHQGPVHLHSAKAGGRVAGCARPVATGCRPNELTSASQRFLKPNPTTLLPCPCGSFRGVQWIPFHWAHLLL